MAASERIEFSRFKYGRELGVDAYAIERWTGIGAGGWHHLDFFELLLIKRGRGRLWSGGDCLSLTAPAIVVSAPFRRRRIHMDEPARGRLVVFAADAAERVRPFTPGGLLDGVSVLPVSADGVARVAQVAGTIAGEIAAAIDHQAQMLDTLVAQALVQTGRARGKVRGVVVRPPAIVSRLMTLIDAHFREERRVEAYARKLGVGADHLSAVTRRHTGVSAKHLIHARVTLEARRLLTETDLAVAAIAEALGYDEPSHFARAFHAAAGVRPSAFRRAHSETHRR